MSVGIYVPTLGRVGRTPTMEMESSVPMRLVCPPEERGLHDFPHIVCDKVGIGPVRQHILDNAKEDTIIMIDDDMMFFKRSDLWCEDFADLKKIWSLDPIVEWIESRDELHGGVSARQGNQNVKVPHKIGRVNNFHFFKREILGEVDFTVLPVMEDFYVTLSLLTQGFPNAVVYDYCWNQRGSGAVGGCSGYRTLEMQAEAAFMLHDAFPDFVKVVDKKTKGSGIFEGTRKDVIIQWIKAWKSSQ